MPIKEVTALRRAGLLNEAYNLALHDLEKAENDWTKISLFWVLRDICISKLELGDSKEVLSILERMKVLLPHKIDDFKTVYSAYDNLIKQVLPLYDTIKSAVVLSKTDPTKAFEEITKKINTDGNGLDPRLHEDFGWIIYRYLKAKASELSSIEIHNILRDYLNLKNQRPSLLHSIILNFALNYAKEHSDFLFQNFFNLWGVRNLRKEDLHNNFVEDKEIPSLLARICKFYVEKGLQINLSALHDFMYSPISDLADMVREQYYWFLYHIQKEGDVSKLWIEFNRYTESYAQYGPSKWHTEILKLATDFYSMQNVGVDYIQFVKNWGINNFLDSDWNSVNSKASHESSGVAVKVLQTCFEIFKKNLNISISIDQLAWLTSFYDIAIAKVYDVEWLVRHRALISLWSGNTDDAINRFKSILIKIPDQYYAWHDLSKCIEDVKLKIGLLLKAKSLETNEDFLGEIRLDLADALLSLGYVKQAQKNLEAYIKHKHFQGRKPSERYICLADKCISIKNNLSVPLNTKNLITDAENYVFGECIWLDFVLTNSYVLKGTEFLRFTDGKNISFTVKAKNYRELRYLPLGSIVSFRCEMPIFEKGLPEQFKEQSKTSKEQWIKPLMAKISPKAAWSILPIEYGVVDYIDPDKNLVHILSPNGTTIISPLKRETNLQINDFVKFYSYTKRYFNSDTNKEEEISALASLSKTDELEAILHFYSLTALVFEVNTNKELFHIALGKGQISDIVRFKHTNIRPKVGDFLKITCVPKKNKAGKTRFKFLKIEPSEIVIDRLVKTTSGLLTLKYNEGGDELEPLFGTVIDIYVGKQLLLKHNIKSNCQVSVRAVLTNSYKWRAFDLKVKE